MTHTDKALVDSMEQIKALSSTCQQQIFENTIDLGKHELVVHALLDKIQETCNELLPKA